MNTLVDLDLNIVSGYLFSRDTYVLSVPLALSLLSRSGMLGFLTRRYKIKDKHASYLVYGVSAIVTQVQCIMEM